MSRDGRFFAFQIDEGFLMVIEADERNGQLHHGKSILFPEVWFRKQCSASFTDQQILTRFENDRLVKFDMVTKKECLIIFIGKRKDRKGANSIK